MERFRHDEDWRLLEGHTVRHLPANIQERTRTRLLQVLDARTLTDLWKPASNRFEALRGDREGQYSIRINDRWRICFSWVEKGAMEIEVVDYH